MKMKSYTDFEQALNEAWERYHCHGWLVDQFEDNYGECAFAKGFREGSRWMLDNPSGGALYHVLNKGVKQGYKDAVEKTCEWLKDNVEIYFDIDGNEPVIDVADLLKDFERDMGGQE